MLIVGMAACVVAGAQVTFQPNIHGTVRAKYEYQTEEGEGRFEVRNARISIDGDLSDLVAYKAEIDLSDEGSIKMLDAYGRFKLLQDLKFTIGQMRVPFTIDAHRSPHAQYFANRSFIAKQVGNVRDVGATLSYQLPFDQVKTILEAGLFNGSGLTDQKNYWTKSVNFSAKAQLFFQKGFNVTLSVQKTRPDHTTVMMYDGGVYWENKDWHIEAEYLYKHYGHDAFDDVHSVDAFVCYNIWLSEKCAFKKISPLVRYDFMTDHSDGVRYNADGEEDASGEMMINDYQRGRLTAGATFSLNKPFVSDIRVNFEKYFYEDDAYAKTSEKDKIVVEFMLRF